MITRKSTKIHGLEFISHIPKSQKSEIPVLFVHGAFVAAWCWDEYFLPYFAQCGFAAHALSLRGHGGSDNWETLSLASMDDYEADVLAVVRHLGGRVIVVGHSMGAMVLQRSLRRMPAAAAVLMASVPPEGLFGSTLMLAARDPDLFKEINLIQYTHPAFATHRGLQRAIFSERIADADLGRHFARMQPESQRAVFDMSWPQHFFIARKHEVPVLVVGGTDDALFSPAMIESTARIHGVAPVMIPDMAHAMMLEPNWQVAADRIVGWLSDVCA